MGKLVAGLKKFSIRMHEGIKKLPSDIYKITTERR